MFEVESKLFNLFKVVCIFTPCKLKNLMSTLLLISTLRKDTKNLDQIHGKNRGKFPSPSYENSIPVVNWEKIIQFCNQWLNPLVVNTMPIRLDMINKPYISMFNLFISRFVWGIGKSVGGLFPLALSWLRR